MPTRKKELKPDVSGNYRPNIGWRKDGKQQKFSCGKDKATFEYRRDKIQQLYSESCQARRAYGLPESWTDAALHAAMMIAEGNENHILLPPASVVNEASGKDIDIGGYDPCWDARSPRALLWTHGVASRLYPSIRWIIPDAISDVPALTTATISQSAFDQQAKRHAAQLGAKVPSRPFAGMLHQALQKYDDYLTTDYKRENNSEDSTVHQKRSLVKALLQAHDNQPLANLDYDGVDAMFGLWRGRPVGQDGKKLAVRTCRHRTNELNMFFNWLHKSPDFAWRKPEDYNEISKTIAKDRTKRSIREMVFKKTYDLEQLKKINEACTPLERVILLLGLNCCFGASETGRLEFEDLFLDTKNPLGHLWKNHNFVDTETDSWIAYLRPKTGVAGCWWLFPETVKAIEEWSEVRPQSETDLLVVSGVGSSLYREKTKNAQSKFAKIWTDLVGRVAVPYLPFGTVRDQFADWCVGIGESESSSIALAHGSPFKDDLLSSYANRPFPRLFDIQRRYHEFLRPIF